METCADIQTKATEIFINFTENAFDFLIRASLGIARNTHEEQSIKKSINVSETIPITANYEIIKGKLETLCNELSERAQQQKLSGRTLIVEFKSEKFKNKQKSFTHSSFMDQKNELFGIALSLMDSAWPLEPCRQISVKLLNLKDEFGRKSYSATLVMQMTEGKTKLGGRPNIEQPKPVMKVKHHIPQIFDDEPPQFPPWRGGRGGNRGGFTRGWMRGAGYGRGGSYRSNYHNPEEYQRAAPEENAEEDGYQRNPDYKARQRDYLANKFKRENIYKKQ